VCVCVCDSGQKLHPFPEPSPDWSSVDLLPPWKEILPRLRELCLQVTVNDTRRGAWRRPGGVAALLTPCLSRRSRRQLATTLNKDGQYGFPTDAEEEPADLDATITFYQLDDADGVFPPLAVRRRREPRGPQGCTWGLMYVMWLLPQGPAGAPPSSMGAPPPPPGSSYRVQRGSGPLPPAPPPRSTPVCSSEDDQEDASTVEDQGKTTETPLKPFIVKTSAGSHINLLPVCLSAEYTEDYIYISQGKSWT